jgi:hypothetical protein
VTSRRKFTRREFIFSLYHGQRENLAMKFRHLFRIVSGEISLALPASNSFAQQNDPSDQPGLLADDSVELDPEFRRTPGDISDDGTPGTIIIQTAESHLY